MLKPSAKQAQISNRTDWQAKSLAFVPVVEHQLFNNNNKLKALCSAAMIKSATWKRFDERLLPETRYEQLTGG